MTTIEFLTAIGGTKSLSTLDGFARTVWQRWGAKDVTDEQAQALAEAIEARKREVRGIDTVAQRAPQVSALAKGGEGRATSRQSASRSDRLSGGRRSSGAGRWRRPAPCRRGWPANSQRGSWRCCAWSQTRRGPSGIVCSPWGNSRPARASGSPPPATPSTRPPATAI